MDDDDISTEAKDRFKLIIEKGVFLEGLTNHNDYDSPPEWYDSHKFAKGQKVIEKYYARYFLKI